MSDLFHTSYGKCLMQLYIYIESRSTGSKTISFSSMKNININGQYYNRYVKGVSSVTITKGGMYRK